MAEIKGVVLKVKGERAEVKVNHAESELQNLPRYLDCWNPINAKIGDHVSAEMREPDNRNAKLIVNGLPVLGVLAGVAFGHSLSIFFEARDSEWMFILAGVVLWLIVTVSYARIFKRDAVRKEAQPVLYEIQVEEMVVDWNHKK